MKHTYEYDKIYKIYLLLFTELIMTSGEVGKIAGNNA